MPKRLESRIRTAAPPALRCTTSRIEEPDCAPAGEDRPMAGDASHAPTQPCPACAAGRGGAAGAATAAGATATADARPRTAATRTRTPAGPRLRVFGMRPPFEERKRFLTLKVK
ncbi:hypothetical protein GCM10023195_65160 [Actinoallomurus liliacearum]|uniref:Uncharacterized protein n=1 Tax=Actinoallomurus liliacearum TaxID=1080073 RepID=A0ABP8TTS0_9ACTN